METLLFAVIRIAFSLILFICLYVNISSCIDNKNLSFFTTYGAVMCFVGFVYLMGIIVLTNYLPPKDGGHYNDGYWMSSAFFGIISTIIGIFRTQYLVKKQKRLDERSVVIDDMRIVFDDDGSFIIKA